MITMNTFDAAVVTLNLEDFNFPEAVGIANPRSRAPLGPGEYPV